MEQFVLYMCSWTINIWTTMVWLQTGCCYYQLWGDDTMTEVKVSTVSFDKRLFFHHIYCPFSTVDASLDVRPHFLYHFQLEILCMSLWQNVVLVEPIVVGPISEAAWSYFARCLYVCMRADFVKFLSCSRHHHETLEVWWKLRQSLKIAVVRPMTTDYSCNNVVVTEYSWSGTLTCQPASRMV